MRWYCIITLALAVAVAAAQPPAEPVFQIDFEAAGEAGTLPEGWTQYTKVGAIEVSSEQAHGGKYSLKIVDPDAENAVGLRGPRIEVTPGEYVWVSWWYYGAAGNNISMYIEFWTADGKRPEPPSRSFGSNGTGKWEPFTGRTRVPEGTAYITLHCNSWSGNQATGYFDDIQFGRGIKSMFDRTPKPPANVTHPCGLYKPADIERAKLNYQKHDWAKTTVQGFISNSQFWLKASDEDLEYWIPDLTPFRVVDCPKCGAGWRFAWGGDDKRITCKNCGFSWPDENYPEDKVQSFPDPVGAEQNIPYYEGTPSKVYGSAQSPIYRLSGRLRYNRINRLTSLGAVGKAYVFTEDIAYAQAARRALLRLAEVYPHYLPHDWGNIYQDYGNLQSGKFSGWKLHDAGTFGELALAYDLTYNSGVYSDEDKVKIEEGCFREFARLMTATPARGCCINDGPYAMGAGVLAGLILGDHKTIAWAIEPPDGFIGFLERYFYRDGHWYEASPSYEGMTLGDIYVTPEALRGYSDPPEYTNPDRYDNLNLLDHPLMRKILLAGAPETMPDGNLPPTNDSTFGAKYPRQRTEQQYYWYPSDYHMRMMAWAFGGKPGDSGAEYSLFRRDPDLYFTGVEPLAPSSKGVVRPGAGYAIMRTGAERSDAALLLDYGPHGSGHGHPDRLNILYYDFGTEMVTDLGYLGAGHPNHPWIRSTASHHHVLVDGKPQANAGGELEAFCGDGPIQATIASARNVYKDITSVYRRYLALIDHGIGRRYVVDLFEVVGGSDHQWGFHGDGQSFIPPALDYRDIATDELGDPKTGYQYMSDVKAADAPGPFVAEWIADEAANFGTRLHMMGQPGTTLIYAKANGLRDRSDPFGERDMYKLLVRRPGPENQFISVFEIFRGEATGIAEAIELATETEAGFARAVRVRYDDTTDIIIIADRDAAESRVTLSDYPGLNFSGRMGVVSLRGDEVERLWMLGGSHLSYGTMTLDADPIYEGTITKLDAETSTATIDVALPQGDIWKGQQLLVAGRTDGAYEIDSVVGVEGGQTTLKLADEPIFTCEEGDAFSIVPSASISRVSGGVWRTGGQPVQVGMVDGKTLPDGQVMVRANGHGADSCVYGRTEGGAWQPLDVQVRGPRASVKLDPGSLGGADTRLYFSRGGGAPTDTTAPELLEGRIGRESFRAPQSGAADLGYIAPVDRISLTYHEAGQLAAHLTPTLVGVSGGTVATRVSTQKVRGAADDRWRMVVRPQPGSLGPDEYTLIVPVGDEFGNESRVVLQFTTMGYVLAFEQLAVIDSSGKLRKSLGGELHTMFYRSEEPGDFVTFGFDAPTTRRVEAALRFTRYSGYGIVQASIDGRPIGEPIDMYAAGLEPMGGLAPLGELELSEGRHSIRIELVGRNEQAADAFMGLCDLVLTPVE